MIRPTRKYCDKMRDRIDKHDERLEKISNVLSGRMFDLASFKMERERDKLQFTKEEIFLSGAGNGDLLSGDGASGVVSSSEMEGN